MTETLTYAAVLSWRSCTCWLRSGQLNLSPFVQDYLSAGGKWLHVDMAGPAFAEDRATGYGVALLSQLVRKLN
jgi:leucyl aminopeptidase